MENHEGVTQRNKPSGIWQFFAFVFLFRTYGPSTWSPSFSEWVLSNGLYLGDYIFFRHRWYRRLVEYPILAHGSALNLLGITYLSSSRQKMTLILMSVQQQLKSSQKAASYDRPLVFRLGPILYPASRIAYLAFVSHFAKLLFGKLPRSMERAPHAVIGISA